MIIGLILVVLALILVGPGPLWVGRWRFLHRVPRAAVLLWQAGTVAALVSIIGAAVLFGKDLLDARPDPWPWRVVCVAVILFALNVVARLVWALASVIRSTDARRARHRHLVDLLGQTDLRPDVPGLRVLAEESPMAYCLPAVRDPRVVLSQGAVERLDPGALSAVLAHERAHLRARHDVVLDTFTALHRAFPFLVRSEVPLREARLLVEMLADDAARRSVGAAALARALVTMMDAQAPKDALGIVGPASPSLPTGVQQRVERLGADVRASRVLSTGTYILAVVLVACPVGLLALGATVG